MKIFNYYYPTVGGSWLLVLVFLLGNVLSGVLLNLLGSLCPSPLWSTMSAAYIAGIIPPLAVAFFVARKKYRRAPVTGIVPVKIDSPSFGTLHPVLFFIVIALVLPAISIVSEPLSELIPMSEKVKRLFESMFINSRLPDMVLSACILAPLCEEFLCRGLIMRGILVSKASPVKAVFWSAFIFAFIHMNPWQAIPAFIIGIFFGWIYYRTGSLWATIFLHCLNNSLSTALSRLIPGADVDSTWADIVGAQNYIILYAVSSVVVLAGIYLLARTMPHINKF